MEKFAKDIQSWLTLIDGLKTYILVLFGLVLWVGLVYEWWTWEQVDQLFALLSILGVGTFRSAIAKLEK